MNRGITMSKAKNIATWTDENVAKILLAAVSSGRGDARWAECIGEKAKVA